MSKIFIVQQEWLAKDESHDTAILGAFYTKQEAIQCMQKERDTLLAEDYNVSLEEIKKSEYFDYSENEDGCSIAQVYDFPWDKISIIETALSEREYIDVLFRFNSKTYCERVYIDQIDITHYDNLWDWWFSTKQNDKNISDTEPVFEITAEKGSDGKITTNNLYINVYENENTNDWFCQIKGVKVRKSWTDSKAFESTKTE